MISTLTFACSKIQASTTKVNNFFRKLSQNPELYQFDSHQGFHFLSGDLLSQNSIFFTQEKFFGVFIKLKFKVIKITPNKAFHFQLIEPLKFLEIKGKFHIKSINKNNSRLCLTIYQDNDLKNFSVKRRVNNLLFSFISPVRYLVKTQITKEVRFLKKTIENLS